MMKTCKLLSVLGISTGFAAGVQGAILQTFAGQTVTDDAITLVDTTTDTGDWIDAYSDASNATLYYGFDFTVVANAGETGLGGYFSALQLYESTAGRLGVGNAWFELDLTAFDGASVTQPLTGTNYVIGETYRYVVQIDYDSAGDDAVKIWIDPLSEVSTSTTFATDAGFTEVQLRSGVGPGTTTSFGNIVFATTFSEAAVPEPGSLALLGLGGLLVARRRRA